MKKIHYLIAMVLMAFTFASCEDVPAPYGQPINPNSGTEEATPSGNGTEASPYNVAGILEYLNTLGADVTSDKDVYITGYVTAVTEAFGTQYGNATFTMGDSETSKNVFTFYRGLYLGNVKYSDEKATNIAVGDKVVVCGKVVLYKGNTPETSQGNAYVVSINGVGGDTKPSGDDDKPKTVTVAEFLAAAESTSVWYQLTGTVTHLEDGTYNNSTKYGNFDLVDASGSAYVYGVVAEKGGSKGQFAELMAAKGIKDGCKITIIGNRGAFNGNAQVTNAYFVSVEAGTDTPTPSDDAYTKVTTISEGVYAIAALKEGTTYVLAQALTSGYGYLKTSDATLNGDAISPVGTNNAFTIKATTGGYTIQDADGQYLYMSGTYNSFNRSADKPSDGAVWTISITSDGAATIKNTTTGKTVQYSSNYTSYGAYTDVTNTLPVLFKKGGSGDGGGETGGTSYKAVTAIANGNFVLGATVGTSVIVAVPLDANKTYGYLGKSETTETSGALSTDAANEFTFKAVTGGYTIQSPDGRYLFMKGTYNSFNTDATAPSEGHVWNITFNNDKTAKITNVLTGKTIQYSSQYNSYGAYTDITNTLPVLYAK
jgi:hypothetical protein